jgi:hypothetical protein
VSIRFSIERFLGCLEEMKACLSDTTRFYQGEAMIVSFGTDALETIATRDIVREDDRGDPPRCVLWVGQRIEGDHRCSYRCGDVAWSRIVGEEEGGLLNHRGELWQGKVSCK